MNESRSVECKKKSLQTYVCLSLHMVQPIREVSPEGTVLKGGAPVAHLGVLAQEALEVVPPEARRCKDMSNGSMLFVPLKYRNETYI